MKKSHIYLLVAIANLLILLGCSSGDEQNTTIVPPEATTLVFPNESSECNEGTNITNTESDIAFDWNDAANTDSYQLYLKNLDTQITTNYSSPSSQLTLTLLRGTPYSWYVVSKNTGTETAQSATWKFYNAGEAVTSYAPFPAEVIAPSMGTALGSTVSNITLDWEGNDIDDDIVEYEVLFGTDDPPTTNQATVSTTSIDVNVTSGNTYYWKVITRDGQGNSSFSEIFQFKVN